MTSINGGAGADTITGGQWSGTVNGGGGDDFILINYAYISSISGGEGNDIISISGGSDLIYGSPIAHVYQHTGGDDVIYGFNTNDTLQIAAETYSTQKSGGDLILKTDGGSVTLKDAAELRIRIMTDSGKFEYLNYWDAMNGTAGNESLSNVTGGVTLNGLGGDDTINNSGQKVQIFGGEGSDSIFNSAYYVTIDGGAGADNIQNNYAIMTSINGGAGDDVILLNYAQTSSISGGEGNDIISISCGSDLAGTINGGRVQSMAAPALTRFMATSRRTFISTRLATATT